MISIRTAVIEDDIVDMEARKRHRSAPSRSSNFRQPEPVHRSRLPLFASDSSFTVINLDEPEDSLTLASPTRATFEAFYISPTRVRASLSRLNLSNHANAVPNSSSVYGSTPRKTEQFAISPATSSSVLSTPAKATSPATNKQFSTFHDVTRHVERSREKQLQSPLVSRTKPAPQPSPIHAASTSNGYASPVSTPSNMNGKSKLPNGHRISDDLPNGETSPKFPSGVHIDLFAIPELRPSYISPEEYEHTAQLLRHAEENASSLRQKANESKAKARQAWDEYRTPPLMVARVPVSLPCKKSEVTDMEDNIRSGSVQETLVTQTLGGEQVTRHDLAHLLDSEWLNDTCINAYLHLVRMRSKESMEQNKSQPKAWVFSSFFLTKLCSGNAGYDYSGVRRITSRAKVDVFALDKVLFPFNLGNHWTMACVNIAMKRIEYYDSLGSSSRACTEALKRWVADEWKDKKSGEPPLDTSSWETFVPKKIPQQRNGFDCGVFTIMFGDYLAQGKPFDFAQADMPALRSNIIWRILKNEPLPARD